MKKIKRLLFFIVILVGLFGIMNKDEIKLAVTQNIFDPAPLKIVGEASVLMDEQTGEVIFSKNEKERLYPASTTKLLTALVVLDRSSLDEQVKIGDEVSQSTEGEARVGLFAGQVQTVEELLIAMLLQSGNDAARSLAVYIAKKESDDSLPIEAALAAFADLMNEKAIALGATDSHFTNPHGLHSQYHFSTAYDLAIIARNARQHDVIRHMISQRTMSTKTYIYTNRNQLLHPESEFYYDGATGMKTGFTDQAGYCLITSAERAGRELIAVVLNSGKETVWSDSISLLDYGFKH